MKKIIFLITIVSMPMLIAMEKEKDIIINFAINPLAEQIEKEQACYAQKLLTL